MSAKEESAKLSDLNKKILEIKKKIQLSEGQRKALFEDCEDERKNNSDEITKLKKDLSELTVSLHENTNTSAHYRNKQQNRQIQKVIGPLEGKSCRQVKELLDLQIIDRSKQLDLLRYEIKKRKKELAKLGEQFKALNTRVDIRLLKKKVDLPIKKSSCELQNNINAVDLQIREAGHIRTKYMEIRKSLKDDASKFESSIEKLNEEIIQQKKDINKLQKILNEAIKMRTSAKKKLHQEEKIIASYANQREKEVIEGRKLINDNKLELEKLEKRIYQGGKLMSRPEPEGAEEGIQEEEKPETPPHQCEALAQDFEVLKAATGSTSIEEVLHRFKSQKETNERLMMLRVQSENDKRRLEKQKAAFDSQLEVFRFEEVKDAERKSCKLEEIQEQIKIERVKVETFKKLKDKKCDGMKVVMCGLRSLLLNMKPEKPPKEDEDPFVIIETIKKYLDEILQKIRDFHASDVVEVQENVQVDVDDDKWLPTPYTSLVRRTPLPQQGPPPTTPIPGGGTDDEEDVPSRGYLKRQAQLVVDAKTRRKNLRVTLAKK